MAINCFIPDIGKTSPPDYEYAISFHQKCFVLELFHRKYSVRPPSWIDFQKIIFGSHDLCDVKSRVESKQQIYFIRRILRLRTSSEKFGAF
jgi:hypothetical protein